MGTTTNPNDPGLSKIDKKGLQEKYLVAPDGERVRPLRDVYTHERCGQDTVMGAQIALTYATKPDFYGATYCADCRAHFRVGATGEFVWKDTDIKVGT